MRLDISESKRIGDEIRELNRDLKRRVTVRRVQPVNSGFTRAKPLVGITARHREIH